MAPARASAAAVSAPRPEAAPVTMAACPLGSMRVYFRSSIAMHVWRTACVGIKLLDQRRAPGQHRALVDRALVGGFAGVERRRLGHQDQPADAGRAAGALPRQRVEAAAELVAQLGVGQHRRGRRVGGEARELAAGLDVGKHQHGDVVAVGAGDHRVAHQRRAMVDELRAQRAGADPGAAGELEVLGEAAVEQQALAGIGGIDELQRVADLVDSPRRRTPPW